MRPKRSVCRVGKWRNYASGEHEGAAHVLLAFKWAGNGRQPHVGWGAGRRVTGLDESAPEQPYVATILAPSTR